MMMAKRDSMGIMVKLLVAVVLCAWIPAQAVAQAPETGGTALVQVVENEEVGAYLADGDGMSLYLFERDTTETSTCYDSCANAWPPLITDGAPDAGTGVNAELLGTTPREGGTEELLGTIPRGDGAMQVTYNGWPLYYYGLDKEAGDIEGQDIEDYGAEWYLISPEGTKIEGEDHASEE